MLRVLLAGGVILWVLCSVSYSATYEGFVPAKDGGCYDPDTGIVTEVGEHYDMKNCAVRSCSLIDETHAVISGASCGSVGFDENLFPECHLERRMHLPYPDCCPRIVCQ